MACSTLVYFSELVSKNLMPYSSASCLPSSIETCLWSNELHLLPTNIITAFSGLFSSKKHFHFLIFSKLSLFVMSYTIMIPCAQFLQNISVKARYLSWPAVSHIAKLTFLRSRSIVLSRKSTPTVGPGDCVSPSPW